MQAAGVATAQPPLLTSCLSNGLKVKHVSRRDLHFIYSEVYQQESYIRRGVELQPGAVVLDIGETMACICLSCATAVFDCQTPNRFASKIWLVFAVTWEQAATSDYFHYGRHSEQAQR